jgi:hypothetical protein
MFAAWADFRASAQRVPCRIGPLNFGVIAHGMGSSRKGFRTSYIVTGASGAGSSRSFLINFQRVVVDTIINSANRGQEVHASLRGPEVQDDL